MSLLALQQEFARHLTDEMPPSPERFGSDAERRLGIYRSAYRARLMATLRASFDKTWSWIGDEAFDAAARHHIILNPPSSWTLDAYGVDFHTTLSALFPSDPEVAELARLEWDMQQAFAAVDEVPVGLADLQRHFDLGNDWNSVRFQIVASASLRPVSTNAPAIWQAIANKAPPPDAAPAAAGTYAIIWRIGLSPHFRLIDKDEHAALAALLSGADFNAVCSAMPHGDAGAAAVAAGELLGRWIADDLIAALR